MLCYDQPSIPLVRHEQDGDQFKLERYCDSDPHGAEDDVSKSHAWADGLGNTTANEIPRCRFKSLRKIVNDHPCSRNALTKAAAPGRVSHGVRGRFLSS